MPADPRGGNLTGELLWSDPVCRAGVNPSSRGIGVFFGPDVTKRFVTNNDLLCIVRSHAEIKDGCGLNHEGCYTVYSAPSTAKGVKGGVLTVEGNFLAKEGCVFNECSREEVCFVILFVCLLIMCLLGGGLPEGRVLQGEGGGGRGQRGRGRNGARRNQSGNMKLNK